jgi:hypothetical protein
MSTAIASSTTSAVIDHVIVLNEQHLLRLLHEFLVFGP